MQIQIKQKEIQVAILDYITRQGFNLAGKAIAVNFTAGRKETGIYADIYIDEEVPAEVGAEAVIAAGNPTVAAATAPKVAKTHPVSRAASPIPASAVTSGSDLVASLSGSGAALSSDAPEEGSGSPFVDKLYSGNSDDENAAGIDQELGKAGTKSLFGG